MSKIAQITLKNNLKNNNSARVVVREPLFRPGAPPIKELIHQTRPISARLSYRNISPRNFISPAQTCAWIYINVTWSLAKLSKVCEIQLQIVCSCLPESLIHEFSSFNVYIFAVERKRTGIWAQGIGKWVEWRRRGEAK